jgi:hypothetical protein
MTSDEMILLEKRKQGFDKFYTELIPTLVEFVGNMGVNPAHEVLKNAVQFAPYLDRALENMAIADDQDKIWLLTRMGYFVGEYFAQKYGGSWYVNEIEGSRYFGRYVVGNFSRLGNAALMLDPFLISQVYVDEAVPRHLEKLLTQVDAELIGLR